MPPTNNWPKWAKKRHARDFTHTSTVTTELGKKEYHGRKLLARAFKKAKTFDEGKLKRRLRAPEDADKLADALKATRGVDVDVLAAQCARACAKRVEESVRQALEEATARATADDAEAAPPACVTETVDLGDGFDSKDVIRALFDDAAGAPGERVVDGENAYVAAARRLASSSAVRSEVDALRDRLMAIAERMNRAVETKKKRDAWALEKEAREAKKAAEKARAEERAKRRAAGEDVSSSEDSDDGDSDDDADDGNNRNSSDSDSESDSEIDESGYASLSEETLAEMRAAKREAKSSKKTTKQKGADNDDADELDLAPKKKKVKKRMGQRKRREIAVAKFGANAAHLIAERERERAEARAKEEEERNMHPSWRAKRTQAPLIVPSAGKKVKFDADADDGGSSQGANKFAKHGVQKKRDGSKPSRPKSYVPQTEADGPLHPSWQAKLKADAQAWGGGVKPEGKKVVFGDD